MTEIKISGQEYEATHRIYMEFKDTAFMRDVEEAIYWIDFKDAYIWFTFGGGKLNMVADLAYQEVMEFIERFESVIERISDLDEKKVTE